MLDHCMGSSLTHTASFHQVIIPPGNLSFLIFPNSADKKTEKQTTADKNMLPCYLT